jgi:prefoldin subunit 5
MTFMFDSIETVDEELQHVHDRLQGMSRTLAHMLEGTHPFDKTVLKEIQQHLRTLGLFLPKPSGQASTRALLFECFENLHHVISKMDGVAPELQDLEHTLHSIKNEVEGLARSEQRFDIPIADIRYVENRINELQKEHMDDQGIMYPNEEAKKQKKVYRGQAFLLYLCHRSHHLIHKILSGLEPMSDLISVYTDIAQIHEQLVTLQRRAHYKNVAKKELDKIEMEIQKMTQQRVPSGEGFIFMGEVPDPDLNARPQGQTIVNAFLREVRGRLYELKSRESWILE